MVPHPVTLYTKTRPTSYVVWFLLRTECGTQCQASSKHYHSKYKSLVRRCRGGSNPRPPTLQVDTLSTRPLSLFFSKQRMAFMIKDGNHQSVVCQHRKLHILNPPHFPSKYDHNSDNSYL